MKGVVANATEVLIQERPKPGWIETAQAEATPEELRLWQALEEVLGSDDVEMIRTASDALMKSVQELASKAYEKAAAAQGDGFCHPPGGHWPVGRRLRGDKKEFQ